MSDLLATIAGFLGILLVSLVGVFISEQLQVGQVSSAIITIDNIANIR